MNVVGIPDPESLANGASCCLVVSGLDTMRRMTLNQLRGLGVKTVLSARDGAEALRMLHGQAVDVVISDLELPGMSGIDLLRAMRRDEALSTVPLILQTAEAARDIVQEAAARGVSAILLRPYSARQLMDRLERALKRPPHPSPRAEGDAPAERAGAENTSAVSAPGQVTAELAPPRQTILMVDDTPDNLMVLSRLFKGEYRVRFAQDGAKALEVLTSEDPPDLVMLDIMMPGMDGFEVARRMREHPQCAGIPIIFVTAMTTPDARLKGLDLGAIDFVTKPIDPATLKPRVRNFMRYVQMRKDLQVEYDAMVETARLREDMERILRQDLRTPLTRAMAVLEALAQDDDLGRRQREQLQLAEEGVAQALDLINLSTELYKIESGRFELRPEAVPIGELLRRVAESARVRFADKALSISVDIDVAVGAETPLVLGDASLCRAIFQSLMRNACEAAPQGSKVVIQLHDESPLRIVVHNAGVVPMAIRHRLFEKHVRPGEEGHIGTGAYAARLLAQAQGGAVDLEVSDDSQHTAVSVSLPRATAPA